MQTFKVTLEMNFDNMRKGQENVTVEELKTHLGFHFAKDDLSLPHDLASRLDVINVTIEETQDTNTNSHKSNHLTLI